MLKKYQSSNLISMEESGQGQKEMKQLVQGRRGQPDREIRGIAESMVLVCH